MICPEGFLLVNWINFCKHHTRGGCQLQEYLLTRRTNILRNAFLTVIAIMGLTELLLILPLDIPELKGFAFMDFVDLSRANFQILDIRDHGVDLVTGVLLFFWALAGLAAGSRSRSTVQGAISGFLGTIFVVGIATIGGIFLGGLTFSTALPPSLGIAVGLGTATIIGGLGGKLTSSPTKAIVKQKTAKIWTKEEKWVCPSCGANLPPGAFVCPACGTDVIE